ncbi:MAG TPA: hypothetical protein VL981_03295 [Candidatus Methylacidiphilales bacterium]|nr:hypothetical protein [Candidatus Methylacidiphilales bacterium]
MTALIFARLGHYALWDDEAMTALGAKAIMRTGDTSILLDHGNIVAYRNGLHIRNLADRLTPPLASYITAASFSLFGIDAWTARLPFALLGVATVALILFWAREENRPALLVLACGLVCNVSLILFFRQCRYYAAAIFLSTAVVFIYWRWKPSPLRLLLMAGLSALLFAANYMNYVALYVCLAADYVIWHRHEKRLSFAGWLLLLGPQAIFLGAISWIWNPLLTSMAEYEGMNTLGDRVIRYWWYWRDMGKSEFFALPIMLLALGVGLAQRRIWLVRGFVAMMIYVAAVTLTAPQVVRHSLEGEVRYLVPVLPLALALQTGTLCALLENRKALLLVAALLIFGTNLLNGGPFLAWGLRSSILSYLGELSLPQTEPYTPTARWINDNVPEGKSIWVEPYYAVYPLMFSAPRAIYAWQLSWPPQPGLEKLPRIHFLGQEPSDYIIAFGPSAQEVAQFLQNWPHSGIYQKIKTIDVYWQDKYRPELYWRSFESKTDFNFDTEAIYIFQHVPAPASPAISPAPANAK